MSEIRPLTSPLIVKQLLSIIDNATFQVSGTTVEEVGRAVTRGREFLQKLESREWEVLDRAEEAGPPEGTDCDPPF